MSVTMSDIAAKTGTSIAAVSVTLNGAKSKTLRVSEATRQRIIQTAEELGYRRNPNAGALATGRSMVLGFMLPQSSYFAEHDPFFSTLSNGVAAGASAHGYSVMLFPGLPEGREFDAAKIIDRRVDGLILGGSQGVLPIYRECERQRIEVVSIMGSRSTDRWNIECDDYGGGRLATSHLIGLGHRRIAHLSGRSYIATSEPRVRGYLDALQEAGFEPAPEWIVPGDFERATGYASTRRLMELPSDRRPTAIFGANDLSAHGAIEAVQDCGLSVPGDVAVVGFDDTWYATIPKPSLTSVHVDVQEIGKSAVNLLVSLLAGEAGPDRQVTLPVSLTIRESCGFASLQQGTDRK